MDGPPRCIFIAFRAMVGSHFLVGVNAFLFSAVVIVCVFLGYLLRKARQHPSAARMRSSACSSTARSPHGPAVSRCAAWRRCRVGLARLTPRPQYQFHILPESSAAMVRRPRARRPEGSHSWSAPRAPRAFLHRRHVVAHSRATPRAQLVGMVVGGFVLLAGGAASARCDRRRARRVSHPRTGWSAAVCFEHRARSAVAQAVKNQKM
jgi:hypothetical protein